MTFCIAMVMKTDEAKKEKKKKTDYFIEFQEKCTHLQGYHFDFKIVRPVYFATD